MTNSSSRSPTRSLLCPAYTESDNWCSAPGPGLRPGRSEARKHRVRTDCCWHKRESSYHRHLSPALKEISKWRSRKIMPNKVQVGAIRLVWQSGLL